MLKMMLGMMLTIMLVMMLMISFMTLKCINPIFFGHVFHLQKIDPWVTWVGHYVEYGS
jgi:hypothetical protein